MISLAPGKARVRKNVGFSGAESRGFGRTTTFTEQISMIFSRRPIFLARKSDLSPEVQVRMPENRISDQKSGIPAQKIGWREKTARFPRQKTGNLEFSDFS